MKWLGYFLFLLFCFSMFEPFICVVFIPVLITICSYERIPQKPKLFISRQFKNTQTFNIILPFFLFSIKNSIRQFQVSLSD